MARQRKYPDELLDRGARMVFDSGRPIAHVARDLAVQEGRICNDVILALRQRAAQVLSYDA